jgi:hypothetical protein
VSAPPKKRPNRGREMTNRWRMASNRHGGRRIEVLGGGGRAPLLRLAPPLSVSPLHACSPPWLRPRAAPGLPVAFGSPRSREHCGRAPRLPPPPPPSPPSVGLPSDARAPTTVSYTQLIRKLSSLIYRVRIHCVIRRSCHH